MVLIKDPQNSNVKVQQARQKNMYQIAIGFTHNRVRFYPMAFCYRPKWNAILSIGYFLLSKTEQGLGIMLMYMPFYHH